MFFTDKMCIPLADNPILGLLIEKASFSFCIPPNFMVPNFTVLIPSVMRNTILVVLCLLSTFPGLASKSEACEYAGSNLGYVQTQTKKALQAETLNTSRYFAYKALNAIEKSRKQLVACGCEYAEKSIDASLDDLKKATRVSSLAGTKILLNRALDHAEGSLEAIEKHEELHKSKYASDVLSLNTRSSLIEKLSIRETGGALLREKIDIALQDYERSLAEVVSTVECGEAYLFAKRIYQHCEQQLMKSGLSEGKMYYNLRTKEITGRALKALQPCGK